MMRNLEHRETEFMRIQRRKIGIDDFEQLTVIGKGAFGEHATPSSPVSSLPTGTTPSWSTQFSHQVEHPIPSILSTHPMQTLSTHQVEQFPTLLPEPTTMLYA
ncbi:hypothetical protein VIGAN_05267200 [Vigna angularis var. angularis]|uniref:Uncharacterized protein n=1 Tax=Vigna angularis var. angularis TaxID=157739 RepID=A0A0S3S892_PHAAN|nr:hypothetical protein VIGAN_05267200 [Vigna angularis var. angularis]